MSYKTLGLTRRLLAFSGAILVPLSGYAQQTAPASTTAPAETEDENIVVLSPFEVTGEGNVGYMAATTLAGNRLNTNLRDIGNAVQVITEEFLQDTGAVSNETLLQYTTNTEVGSINGNFAGVGDGATLNETDRFKNPNQNTRVRGLAAADNSRDYYLSNVPWDAYNVDRVDLQRGPNSILFGHGSPAGIINTTTKQAGFKTGGEAEVRFDNFGSIRGSLDYNLALVENELAVRAALVSDNQEFQQDPAYQDSNRGFLAGRWEPGFLKQGSARTIIKASFETGDIESNRPRSLPPIDLITPWFRNGTYQGKDRNGNPRTYNELNRQGFNPHAANDDNYGRPGHGQTRPAINGGPNAGQPNPAYNPRVGNFAQSFGGPVIYFNGFPGAPSIWTPEIREVRGIGPDGNIDTSLGFNFNRPVGIATQSNWAKNAGVEFAEIYKNQNLSDPTVFNFYDNLIDGDNKEEWTDFTTFNVSLGQTFMDEKFGFEVSYYAEEYEDGQLSLITDSRQALYIDINRVYPDGTPAGTGTYPDNRPYDDGTPNPNYGRPFISDSGQFGNNSFESDRYTARATLFFTHDFEENSDGGGLQNFLGRHTFTGLVAQDQQETDRRNWQRYAILDQSYRDFLGGNALTVKFTDNLLAPNAAIYLGPSLANQPAAFGIPRATERFVIPSQITTWTFDSTWAAPEGVDPAALWINQAAVPGFDESTQSENPANYVGWRSVTATVTDSEAAPGNRDLLTTSARLTRDRVDSKALVWQGHMLNGSLVGTVGYREDTAKAWGFSRDSNSSPGFGQVDLGETYRLASEAGNEIDVESTAYSVVAHLNDIPGLNNLMEDLPINVSVYYNNSTNFQPLANRVDAYGESLAPPEGETTDFGVMLQSKDGKYWFKVNNYETTVTNASSSGGLSNAWFIGASQAWAGNWANRFEFNWTSDNIGGAVAEPDPTNTQYNYGLDVGETLEDAQAREAAAISAWRAWQAKVDPRFYEAWGINLNDPTQGISASTPQGFTITEDATSEGREVEFSAAPIENWRLTVNASKTTAIRKNVGGVALAEFINGYTDAVKNTPAGDLRIWWGGAGNETSLFQWNSNVGFEWTAIGLQEGTDVPELREWRVNAISTYDFTEGGLKGLSVGGGIRYQDSVTIGYPPTGSSDDFGIDLNSPIQGPSETAFDFWVSYPIRVFDRVDWRIQLNIRNAFQGDELIPISTQPNGQVAGWRIAPPRTFTLTNTFRF